MIQKQIRDVDGSQSPHPRCFPRCRRNGLSLMLLVGLTCAILSASCAHAQQSGLNENQVKSAYLYNFGKFVEWPSKNSHDGIVSFCVLGDDTFTATLEKTISGESINGLKIAVKRIAAPQDALNCHILFLSSSAQGRLKAILEVLENSSVLTVSDMPAFTDRGGMIQFVMEGNRVRFQVNLTNAERAGLTLSSQLLRVATNVKKTTQPGA